MFLWLLTRCLAPEGEGGGQGNGAPQAPQGEGSGPKYVTEEQLNKAITSRFKDLEKKSEKSFADFGAQFSSKFDEFGQRLESFQAPPTKGGKDKSDSPEDHPKWKGMEKQMAEYRAQVEAMKAERDAERMKNREASLRNRAIEALARSGVTERAKHALAMLNSEGRIKYADDSDNIVYRDADGSEMDLEAGLKAWVQSEDGKIYLPARGVKGSGEHLQGKAPGTSGQPHQGLARGELGQALIDMFHKFPST